MLEAIIAISQGKPREDALQSLHTQISLLMEDLGKDRDALTWFNLSTDKSVDGSIPPLPEPPSTPAAAGVRNRLSDQFLGQWPLSNIWELPSEIDFMTGGLASPPDSRYNSPIFLFGSSSSLQIGTTSPSQCVDPRDLHDFPIPEPFPPASDDDQIDQRDSGISEPSSPATNGLPSSPVCVSEKLKSISLTFDNGDEDTAMDGTMTAPPSLPPSQEDNESVVVKEPESKSSDDISNEEDTVMGDATTMDATMATPPSLQSSQEDDESKSSDDIDNGEDTVMDDTAMRAPSSSVPLSQGDDLSMVGIDSGEPMPNPPADKVVEHNNASDPSSDLTDLEEDDDEAKESAVSVNSKKRTPGEGGDEASRFTDRGETSSKGQTARPLVRIVEPSQPIGESDQISSDFESAVKLAAQVELRRSARNIARNNSAKTVNYVDFARPRKSSFSKKKPALDDEIDLQASFPCLSLKK